MATPASPERKVPRPAAASTHSYTRTLEHLAARPSKTLSHSYRHEPASSASSDAAVADGSPDETQDTTSPEEAAVPTPQLIVGREGEIHEAVRRAMGLRRISETEPPLPLARPALADPFLDAGVESVSEEDTRPEAIEEESDVDDDDRDDGAAADDDEPPPTAAAQPRRISFASEATFYCGSPSSSRASLSSDGSSEGDALEAQTPTSECHPLPPPDVEAAGDHAPESPVASPTVSSSPLSLKKLFRRSTHSAHSADAAPIGGNDERAGAPQQQRSHTLPPSAVRPLPGASPRSSPRLARPPIKIVTEADVAAQSRALEEDGAVDPEAAKSAEICFML